VSNDPVKRSFIMVLLAVGAFLLFITLSISIQRWIVYPQFEQLQVRSIEQNMAQLRAAVDREAQGLAVQVSDYAEWNDTYAFVQSLDAAFPRDNFLSISSFLRGAFHCVWVVRADGLIIYHADFNSGTEEVRVVNHENGERLLSGHPFLAPLSGAPITGVIPTDHGPTLVAIHSILTSEGEGPPRGTLVMGRRLDAALAERLSAQIRLPTELRPADEFTQRGATGIPVNQTLPSGDVETSLVVDDLFGFPAVTLVVRTPLEIEAVGQRALIQSVVAVVGQGVLFLLIGGAILRQSMRRSRQAEIERELEERTANLRETEEYLKTIMDTVPAGIIIVDASRHTILDINPAGLGMIVARREDVIGQICHKFICPALEGQCPVTDLGGVCDRAERQLVRTDGSRVPVLKTVVPTHLRGRNCLLECFVDITDQKTAEEKIHQSIQDMARMNRAMIGREERILELKHEVNELLRALARTPRYLGNSGQESTRES
jgi:PAS domain S-box-containing protein